MNINPDFHGACCKATLAQNGKCCPVCRANLPYRVKVGPELRLGDHIKVIDGSAYNTATVLQIDDEKRTVKILRPYVHTGDFIYTGGVIGYLGFEEFELLFDTDVIMLQESSVVEVVQHETNEGRKKRKAS